jgi:hypothetical protein
VTHSRPAPGGKPADLWALTCDGGCEDFLRSDPLWSSTIAEIPETPDESITREDWSKRGAADQQYVTAMALAKMAGVDIPESLTRVLSGRAPAVAGMMECGNGHASAPGSKFCGECGEAMRQPAAAIEAAPVFCAQGHPNPSSARFCGECGGALLLMGDDRRPAVPEPPAPQEPPAAEVPPPAAVAVSAKPGKRRPMKDWRADELKAHARSQGLKLSGEETRAELLKLIRGAKVAA